MLHRLISPRKGMLFQFAVSNTGVKVLPVAALRYHGRTQWVEWVRFGVGNGNQGW